jgi:hypothetical protein
MFTDAEEVLYGGAQGGGKSYALRAWGVNYCMTYPGAQVVLFRRTYKELEDSHILAIQKEVPSAVAHYGAGLHNLTFDNGSILQFRYCEKEDDYTTYFTTEFDAVMFDEVTMFTERQYIELIGRCRSTKPWWPGRRIRCSGMPTGVGRAWVKKRWIDNLEPNKVWQAPQKEGGMTRLFIPAKLEDNDTLMAIDPNYIHSLEALPYEEYQARVMGNWDITSDQFFQRWRDSIHIVEPFEFPDDWQRFLCVDYGFNAPYAALWFSRPPGSKAAYFYREHYGKNVKLDEQIYLARQATDAAGEKLTAVILDPAMFGVVNVKGEKVASMADDWKREFSDTAVVRGNNDRIPGWRLMREMVDWTDDGMGKLLYPPKLHVFNTCPNLARTIPDMVSHSKVPEDINSESEDHAVDAARYGLTFAFQGRGREGVGRQIYINKGRVVVR